jgi:hypothetical protein
VSGRVAAFVVGVVHQANVRVEARCRSSLL